MMTNKELYIAFLETKLNELKRQKMVDFLYTVRNTKYFCNEMNLFLHQHAKGIGLVDINPSKDQTEETKQLSQWLQDRAYDGLHVKPCPFCGAMPHIEYDPSNQTYHAQCDNVNCNAQLEIADTLEEAIEVWNRRVEPPED